MLIMLTAPALLAPESIALCKWHRAPSAAPSPVRRDRGRRTAPAAGQLWKGSMQRVPGRPVRLLVQFLLPAAQRDRGARGRD